MIRIHDEPGRLLSAGQYTWPFKLQLTARPLLDLLSIRKRLGLGIDKRPPARLITQEGSLVFTGIVNTAMENKHAARLPTTW